MPARTHGMSNSPEFRTWTDIQTRCHNQRHSDYADYGGRGIAMCPRWKESFESFYSDMGPKPSCLHSIERDDVDGNYEPGNCRWATKQEQANNKRNSRRIEIAGVTKTLAQWAQQSGLTPRTIQLRMKAGVVGAALLAPSRSGGLLEFNGETNTYAGWSEKTGIKPSTIAMRLTKYKWSVERALTEGARP